MTVIVGDEWTGKLDLVGKKSARLDRVSAIITHPGGPFPIGLLWRTLVGQLREQPATSARQKESALLSVNWLAEDFLCGSLQFSRLANPQAILAEDFIALTRCQACSRFGEGKGGLL